MGGKVDTAVFVLLIISVGFLGWGVWGQMEHLDEVCPTCYFCEQIAKREVSDYQFIEILNKKFSKVHNYSDVYDCRNYSRDYAFVMKSLGYDVGFEDGCQRLGYGNFSCHVWNRVCLEIEPQYGMVVNYESKYPYSRQSYDGNRNEEKIIIDT